MLDEDDIALLKTYGLGPYANSIKTVEKDLKDISSKVNEICGIKESGAHNEDTLHKDDSRMHCAGLWLHEDSCCTVLDSLQSQQGRGGAAGLGDGTVLCTGT